jgi:membrane-associated phospholipid phosphatase
MHRGDDRRARPRGRVGRTTDALYSILRFIGRHVRGFWPAIAAFFTLGVVLSAATAAAFAALAVIVGGGTAQGLDEHVLRWVERRRTPTFDAAMLELTTLGDGIVILMLVAVASIFLWLTQHRWSVYILLVGVLGGKVLNNGLKLLFARPRPSVVEWIDQVSSPSFPSGHAMSAIIAYGSVAFLVARLEPTPALRRATWALAALLILGVGISRIYLGVHYPSDVLGGFLAGLAWLVFVVSSVTAVRFFAPRRPETRAEERGLDTEQPTGDRTR